MRTVQWAIAALVACGGSACLRALPGEVVERHPGREVRAEAPTVVEASAPGAPEWAHKAGTSSVGVVLVGSSVASSLDEARAKALAELATLAERFVAVDVDTRFESMTSHEQEGGEVREREHAKDERRLRGRGPSTIAPLDVTAEYWERIRAPSGVEHHRVLVRAILRRAQLDRARAESRIQRARARGHGILAIDATAARGLGRELTRRLADVDRLFTCDVAEVAAPDLVLRVEAAPSTLGFALVDGRTGALRVHTVLPVADDRFAAEERWHEAIRRALEELPR